MENDDQAESLEPVFIAASLEEVRKIEQLLATEGIEYKVRPQPFRRGSVSWSAPFDGLLFEVLSCQAAYCRKLFSAKGLLQRGVLPDSEGRIEFPVE